MIKENDYKELINLYENMDNELILYHSYDKIVDFVNSSRISITEEEIIEYCLEHSSRKFEKLILKGKYELDFSLLQRFRSETSILRTNCQLLFDSLDMLIENKNDENFSLKLGKLATEIIHSVRVLNEVVKQGNDPETYFIYNKLVKKQKEFPVQFFSVFFAGAFLIIYKLSTMNSYFENIYYKINNPYDNNRLTLTEDEINNIKMNLKSELKGKVPQSSLDDNNIENYFLLNAIYENDNLDDTLKDYFYDLIEIIEDNPYLNKEKSYITLSILEYEFKERPKDVNPYIKAQFLPNDALIEYFYDDYDGKGIEKHSIHHEDIHALFNLPDKKLPSFFREGVTELLRREYLNDDPYSKYTKVYLYSEKYILTYTYVSEVTSVKLLCDLVGSDKVLEAYTRGDITIIYDALEKITGTREDAEALINTLNSDLNKFRQENKLEFSTESENIFNQFAKYKEAKFNSENTRKDINSKMNFDYNMTILRYIYHKDGFFNKYEELVNDVGVLEKAYFYDELKKRSRNQIVNYSDRVKILYSDVESKNEHKILEKISKN